MTFGGYVRRVAEKEAPTPIKAKEPWAQEFFDIIDEYELQPADQIYFQSLVFENKSFRYALRRDLTEKFEADFKFRNQADQCYIYELIEPQGRGKTIAALKLCKKTQKIYENAIYRFVYSITLGNHLTKILKQHDIIVNDENLNLIGKNAINTLKKHKNLLSMCREFGINHLFNTQELVKIKNVDIYLQIFGYDKETGTTRLLWIGRGGRYEGLVYLKEQYAKEEIQAIKALKTKKWEQIMTEDGAEYADEDLDFAEADVIKVIEKISQDPMYKRIHRSRDVATYIKMKCLEIPKRQVKSLASIISLQLAGKREEERERAREEKQKEQEASGYLVSDDPILNWEDPGFRDLVLQNLQKVLTPAEYNIFRDLCYAESVRDTALKYFGTATNVKPVVELKTKVQQNFLGVEGGECAYKTLLQQQNKKFDYFGGNSDEPDFIVHSDREIISLKTYTQFIPAKAKHHIGTKEVSAAIRLNYKLFLVVYSMKEACFKKYAVSIPGVTQVPSEGPANGTLRVSQAETPLVSSVEATTLPLPAPPPNIATFARETGGVSKKAASPKKDKRRRKR